MRTSAKILIVIGSVALLVAANEWHRTRERAKLAEAYVEAIASSTLPERRADDLFPATLQATMLRMFEHDLSRINDRPARAAEGAKYFVQAYVPVAEYLPKVCKQHGVEISPFQSAYVALHADALARARENLTPAQFEEARTQMGPEVAVLAAIESHVREWSADGASVADACRALSMAGADLAAQANLAAHAPRIYGSLFGVDRR